MCNPVVTQIESSEVSILPGAHQTENYIASLHDKRVGVVVNHTSTIGHTHLVDSLFTLGVNITKIFAPEHGYKGDADAGAHISDGSLGNAKIISLYGKKKKPLASDLYDVDILLFDIQDVGVRFYTYISTLHFVMESAAENDIPIIVLDRPNPNGFYVDGPMLNPSFSSFVGMHPVPVVYGLTIGEYATMINGEGWLKNKVKADLRIVKLVDYAHDMTYDLPIRPSPNLPNLRSILLYPSICFFEGTRISVGRGTSNQFQVIGHPDMVSYDFSFTPQSGEGSQYPKHENVQCFGLDLTKISIADLKAREQLDLSYLIEFFKNYKSENEPFFIDSNFFNKLAGSDLLKNQLNNGLDENGIKKSWEKDLKEYKMKRKKYLLYPDFE